jgi:hypothetical protein
LPPITPRPMNPSLAMQQFPFVTNFFVTNFFGANFVANSAGL